MKRKGFTLIELLTVIAIIGVLAAILIPTVGKVRKSANQAKSSANVRSIAQSYNVFSTAGGSTKVIGNQSSWDPENSPTQATSKEEWALVLAQGAELTDASLYFIDSDPEVAAAASLPRIIGSRDNNGQFQRNEDWTGDLPISYNMVVDMSPNAQTSTTPLLWTKGLQTDGYWAPAVNPWGADGGHIGYMDGHVQFFDNTVDQLIGGAASAQAGDEVSDITLAIQSTSNAEPVEPIQQ